jgi:hypothetical protein
MTDQEHTRKNRAPLFKLTCAAEYQDWRSLLQNDIFEKTHNNNMDRLTTADTLDKKFFAKLHADDFEAKPVPPESKAAVVQEAAIEFKKISADTNGRPWSHAGLLKKCTEHALVTGEGFLNWVYTLFGDIFAGLSNEIRGKVSGVVLGDVVSLLQGIKIAVHHFETNDPEALEIQYSKCSMDREGKNDVMTYTAALTTYMKRLDAAGVPVRDAKAQRILLNGLDQELFESFIATTSRFPYDNYDDLQQALLRAVEKPHMLRKLATLKPGAEQASLMVTQAEDQQPQRQHVQARFEKLETILVSLAKSIESKQASPTKSRNSSKKTACGLFFNTGNCRFGAACKFSHNPIDKKWCVHHESVTHNTVDCNQPDATPPSRQHANATRQSPNTPSSSAGHTLNGYDFCFPTRYDMPQHVFAVNAAPKIDMWCVDGASTTFATYDEGRCFNVRPCNVNIFGPNCKDNFVCTKVGDCDIPTFDKDTGKTSKMLATNVLISPHFPFHIFSEILAFEKRCTATKSLGSWKFFSPDKQPLFNASQRLLGEVQGHSDVKLYFIEQPEDVQRQQRQHSPAASLPAPAAHVLPAVHDQRPSLPPKVNTAKNLHMLLELHCAHDHWNFEAVAKQYGLTLPIPPPVCWACLLAKPRRITRDKVSTRQCNRVSEGFAADAKGPFTTPTPEGYRYYFLIVCLYSHHYWSVLAKAQSEWESIWKVFVKREEARSGKQRCVSFIITDNHKVHSQRSVKDFNDDRGIQTIATAPQSQWQDPAERGIQTITNGARTSLIHGGGKDWMWGHAIKHSTDSTNRMYPPVSIPGHEKKSRLRIAYPGVTLAKEMRRHKPFLCLGLRTLPDAQRGSDFNALAEPFVYLRYEPDRKAFALLTLPNLYLKYSIEVRFLTGTFPLRVTDYLTNQMDTFLRPTAEDDIYSSIHGPGNVLRRHRLAAPAMDPSALIRPTPVLARLPSGHAELPGPGYSSTRGYTPSQAGLQSAAYMPPSTPVGNVSVNSVSTQAHGSLGSLATFTPDQLAARTPRSIFQALKGPDSEFWIPSIVKDFAVLRDQNCIINVTSVKPAGPAPPPVEQRFKIKYRAELPIALRNIDPADWKARTVTRGDRFKYGLHYDATDAPVIHTPALKVLLAWAVEKGLLLYQWDQGAAFYGNPMDRKGVIVQLPPGYDPDSKEIRPLHLPPLFGELARALPGIPQGSLLHYRSITPALRQLQFMPVDADNCLFLHTAVDMATSLHVDDGVLAVPSHEHAVRVLGEAGLGAERTITWGPLTNTLGVDFKVVYSSEKRVVFMSQRAYAVTILERAGMLECNPAKTPARAGQVYTKNDCPTTPESKAELKAGGMLQETYHTLVASLNFLVTISRDDMKFVQGKLAKYCLNPGQAHFQALKHNLRFLKGTLDYGIEFIWRHTDVPSTDGPICLQAWSDSSYGDDVDTGRTTLGDVIKVNGATVSATSKLSSRVDSCVNHSELRAFTGVAANPGSDEPTDGSSIAFNKTTRTITWIRGIKAALERREVEDMPPTPVYVDNAGVLAMINGNTIKSANKHIYRTLAEARERVHLDKSVQAIKIGTKDNLANAMTKQEQGLDQSAAQLRCITGPISVN